MAKTDVYCCIDSDRVNSEYRIINLETLMRFVRFQLPRPFIWSARLSTGLLGLTNCSAGNRGPKKYNEVLLAVGEVGLRKLVDLGFITCPVCRPENTAGFWNAVENEVKRKYAITTLDEFVDKAILPFDVRRIRWEELVPVLGQWPGRLYVPRGLQESELKELKSRIEVIGCGSPLVGYYNPETSERFTQYNLG